MSGVAVAAGMAFSAPAMAATSTPSPAGHAVQVAPRYTWSEGTYRTLGQCRTQGLRGVWSGEWDSFRCVLTRRGFELIVTERWNDWNRHHGNNWNFNNGHPIFLGNHSHNQGPHNQGPHNQGPHNQGPHNQGPHNQGPHNQGPHNNPMHQPPKKNV